MSVLVVVLCLVTWGPAKGVVPQVANIQGTALTITFFHLYRIYIHDSDASLEQLFAAERYYSYFMFFNIRRLYV